MAQNKETSVGIKLVADLRNYQTNLSKAQKNTKTFGRNVKQGMGDATGSITQLARGDIRALPAFFKSATMAAGGFSKGMKGVQAALIATGIGALIVGLGLAVGALTQFFKGTEEGQIAFKKVMNNVAAYIEPVLQMLGKFGKAILLFTKGKFGEAWETAKGAVQGTGEQIKKNKENLDELNAAEENYIKTKRKNILENKKLEAEISSARLKANDEDRFSAIQRQKAINEAIAKQKELAANKNKELELETTIANIKASFGDNDIETNDKLAELKAQQFEITREQNKKLMMISETQQRINREINAEVTARQRVLAIQKEQAETSGLTTLETKSTFTLEQKEVDTTQLADMGNFIDANTEKVKKFREEMDTTMLITDQIGLMGQAFGQLGANIGGAAGSFLQMAGNVLSMVPQLITQIVALTGAQGSLAISQGVVAAQAVPFPLNLIALAATISSVVAALATKPPALASGGLAFGDTLARVGEYSGARANPEVIAPLDKLKGMLGTQGGGTTKIMLAPAVKIGLRDISIGLKEVDYQDSRRR